MKKFSAEMKVVRFGAEDVIVTSGAADMVFHSTMGDNIKANGTVTFNGLSYTLDTEDKVWGLLDAIEAKYPPGYDNINIDSGSECGRLLDILGYEFTNGFREEDKWVGSYTYDANAKKFIKQ